MTPFSLADLGLSDDEIAAFGTPAAEAAPPPRPRLRRRLSRI
ncbi:MAG: hypothetical protein U0Z44_18450 [Kouleothrix sp.]